MEFLKLIEERRSIRAYEKSEAITKEEIAKMIYAALQAPSWKNTESGRYYAAITPEEVETFRTTCLPGFNAERTENVLAFIVTAYRKGNAGFAPDGTPTDANGEAWGAYDLGLQNENLLLCARDMGYDTLVMGLRREELIRVMFDIPENEAIMSVIAVGKRATNPEKPSRRELEEVLKIL